MTIGIDGNEANVEKQVGVSVYTHNLLRYFKHISDASRKFRIYLREPAKAHMPAETDYFQYVVVQGKFMWSQFFLPAKLYTSSKLDLFFSPAHYAPRYCPAKQVVTIHDLSYFYYPEEFLKKDLYKLKNWTEYSIKNAARVISVSKTTKKDITKFYNAPDEKISVIYNGFEKHITDTYDENWPSLSKKYNLKKESYVLYVGTLQPRKNINTLIRAFIDFSKIMPDAKLVLTGRKGWLYEEIFKEVPEQKKDSIIFTGFLSDEEVATLYKNAFCFVMPSLYEGFGIPILEAMSYDCPVISSFSSSLPEVGGDACLYFDPNNHLELMSRMHLLLKEKSVRKELIKNGKKRIQLFSWEKCARETLEILESTAASSS